jgi:serine/threonine-protein kinase
MVEGRLPSRYRVIEEVGQGGMAVVFRAHDDTLRREVAVKLLHAHLLAEPESKARLEREAQAVAKLQHDNIVQIFDYSGRDSTSSYIVTEFIDGQTLRQFVLGRKLPAPEVAALIAIELGSALQHAHELGIIHRDIKPENVMVRKDGVLKLMDFGLAQVMDLERMTVTGQLLGSPAYMAPELLEGRPLDVRSDVFSLGIMLYQLATGALPFSGRNPHEVLKRIAEGRFADPRTVNRAVADRLVKIIARALARSPEDRYASIEAFLDDLRAFVADAGLAKPREELRHYFTNPEAYERELLPRMVTALVGGGKRERAEKRTARALELWNRALAIDPTNQEVLGELKRLEGRQNVTRIALAGAGLAALGGVLVFAYRSAGTLEEPVVPEAAARDEGAATTKPGVKSGTKPSTKPAAATATATTSPPLEAVTHTIDGAKTDPRGGGGATKGAGTRDSSGRPRRGAGDPTRPEAPAAGRLSRAGGPPGGAGRARAAAPPLEKRIFPVLPFPRRAEILVDGESRGIWGPNNTTVEVDWPKEHVITFKSLSDCCDSVTMKVSPGHVPPDGRLVARLPVKPGYVTVRTTPHRAVKIRITEIDPENGKRGVDTTDKVGERVPISFDDDDDLRKTLRIMVDAGPKTVFKEPVEVRPSLDIVVDVKLE